MNLACHTCLCQASDTSDARRLMRHTSAGGRTIGCARGTRHRQSCRSCRCLHPRPSRRWGSHPLAGGEKTALSSSLQVWLLLLCSEEDPSGLADVIRLMSSLSHQGVAIDPKFLSVVRKIPVDSQTYSALWAPRGISAELRVWDNALFCQLIIKESSSTLSFFSVVRKNLSSEEETSGLADIIRP